MRTDVLQDRGISETNVEYVDEITMSIPESAMHHIAFAFANIYNDPETAVIREYIANAVDATRNGGEVHVIAPTSEIPVFVVKDTGTGMSMDTVRNVYSSYFVSTKNQSSEDIGGWGIGAMSGMAIADQFSVTTTKDEVRVKMTVSKEGLGMPKILIESVETIPGKENGTAISIPVQDVPRFNSKLNKFLFFMSERDITVDNLDVPQKYNEIGDSIYDVSRIAQKFLDVDGNSTDIYMVEIPYYQQREQALNRGIYLVMGGIYYEIPKDSIGANLDSNLSQALDFMANYITVIEAKIDSVSLSPNREGVQFTKKTREFFDSILAGVFETAIKNILDGIDDAEDYREAKKLYEALPYQDPELEWDGIPLHNDRFVITDAAILRTDKTKDSVYTVADTSCSLDHMTRMANTGEQTIVVRGSKTVGSARTSIRTYAKNNGLGGATFLIDTENHKNWETPVLGYRNEYISLEKIVYALNCTGTVTELQYDDILQDNRTQARKRRASGTKSSPARDQRLAREVLTIGFYGDEHSRSSYRRNPTTIGVLVDAFKDSSSEVFYIDESNTREITGVLLHNFVKLMYHKGKNIHIADLRNEAKVAVNAFNKELPDAKPITADYIKKTIGNQRKLTKSDKEALLRSRIAEIIGLGSDTLFDSDKLNDPLIKKVVARRAEDFTTSCRLLDKLLLLHSMDVGSPEPYFNEIIRIMGEPSYYSRAHKNLREVEELANSLGVKGFDDLGVRMNFLILANSRGIIGNTDRCTLYAYINTDYKVYKDNRKKVTQ